MGGEVENEQVYGETVSGALKITEQYDPETQQWTRLPDMNYSRHATQAIVSGNGVFVTAGSNQKGGANQKNMEFLGLDAPVGSPSMASTLSAPDEVTVAAGSSENFELNVSGGNVGIIIRSMELTGTDAANFSIAEGALENALLGSQDSHTLTLSLDDAGNDAEAVLTINYGADASLDIPLRSRVAVPTLTRPDTQYNVEGDDVSLQIAATGAGQSLTYAATGLPPTLTINSVTGLITGTIGEGAGANSPYQVTISTTDAALPENPGTVEFSWIIDTDRNTLAGNKVLVLYPNPAFSQMTLGFGNTISLRAVRIFDRAGRLMKDLDPKAILFNGKYMIDVSMLSEGLYFVNTVDDKGNKRTKQMIIKH